MDFQPNGSLAKSSSNTGLGGTGVAVGVIVAVGAGVKVPVGVRVCVDAGMKVNAGVGMAELAQAINRISPITGYERNNFPIFAFLPYTIAMFLKTFFLFTLR